MASYSDIAKLTGLSFGTISNVLSGKGNVKEINREKVMQAVERLNYRVDYQARALASDRTSLIGLVASDLDSVAQSQMMMPMITFARNNQCRVIVATSNYDKEQERQSCESLLSSNVDGLFVFFEHVENIEYFRKLAQTETTPIIMVSRYVDGCGLPFVAVDNVYAGKCMVDYVYGKGHRKLLYLDSADKEMLSPNRDRREGVVGECKKLGIDYQVISGGASEEDVTFGYEAASSLIESGRLPGLVLTRNDSVAVGFYNACTRNGLTVPEDVSIMSFGNFYPEAMTPRRLSSFDRRFDKVIEAGVNLYISMRDRHICGRDLTESERKIFIKGNVIEGETVADIR